MKPSKALQTAWAEYLDQTRKAHHALVLAEQLFTIPSRYSEANQLSHRARRAQRSAIVALRRAIGAEWGTRYRIETHSTKPEAMTLWVHAPHADDEHPIYFTRTTAIRAPKRVN